jgi:hypothetical protein
LQNVIARAVILCERSEIKVEDICLPNASLHAATGPSFKALKAAKIAEFEKEYIQLVLRANDGNVTKAAMMAKKNRRAFWQLMRKHAICAPGGSRFSYRQASRASTQPGESDCDKLLTSFGPAPLLPDQEEAHSLAGW